MQLFNALLTASMPAAPIRLDPILCVRWMVDANKVSQMLYISLVDRRKTYD